MNRTLKSALTLCASLAALMISAPAMAQDGPAGKAAYAARLLRGSAPPPLPAPSSTTQALWLSDSVQDLRVSDSAADRSIILTATSAWEGSAVYEPSIFYNPTQGLWDLFYTGNWSSPGIGLATSTSPLGPYTHVGTAPVIGQGSGGQSAGANHASIYVEGSTIYFYFNDPSTNQIKLATANVATPQTFTYSGVIIGLSSGTTQMGNSFLIKEANGTYTLFYEQLVTGATWTTGFATGPAPTGPFTNQQTSLPSLAPTAQRPDYIGYGGPNVILENGVYVNFYHAIERRGIGSDIYKATSTDKINWTIANNGYPLVQRTGLYEDDQVADATIGKGPYGDFYAMWTAVNNDSTINVIYGSQMLQPLKRPSSIGWVSIVQVPAATPRQSYNEARTVTGAFTARNRDDIAAAAGGGSQTITLPPAAEDSFVRVSAIQGGTVTVVPRTGETILGTNGALSQGTTAIYHCYYTGQWSRQ